MVPFVLGCDDVSIYSVMYLWCSVYFLHIYLVSYLLGSACLSGGYHTKTYGRCFILSNVVYLVCFGTAYLIQTLRAGAFCPCLELSSMIVLFLLAPIEHKNHPLSATSYQKNRNIAFVLTVCEWR